MSLNPEQQQIVEHGDGPLRGVAVAGSGKTTAIIERVLHLASKRRVDPSRILVLTFGKDASAEVEKRLQEKMPMVHRGIARTFHSLGLEIYKAENKEAPVLDTNGSLYKRAIYSAYRRIGLEPAPKPTIQLASLLKNDMIDISAEVRHARSVPRDIYEIAERVASQAEKHVIDADELLQALFIAEDLREVEGIDHNGHSLRFVTFDDLIYQTALLLRDETVRARWARRWSHIIQDEVQDENATQAAIAESLARSHNNYVVVGDSSQCIYKWRGARPEKMLAFEKEWPGARTVVMFRNYRSGIEIVDTANRILSHMDPRTVVTDRAGKPHLMVSERQTRSYVGYHMFSTDEEEAAAICGNCVKHFLAGVPYKDQAILLRMNYMTRAIEMAMARERVPYKLVSGTSFFDAKETRILLAYLRVVARRATDDHVTSALMYPSRYLGRAFCERVVAGVSEDRDWCEAVRRIGSAMGPRQRRSADEWAALITWLQSKADAGTPPHEILMLVRQQTGLDEWLAKAEGDDEDKGSLATIEEAITYAHRFSTITEMLTQVDEIVGFRNAARRSRDAVTVVTCHKSKGQQWPVVYLAQVAAGRFPARRADIHEERRLFYVACTRAMDELWISRPIASERPIVREPENPMEELLAMEDGLFRDDEHSDSMFVREARLKPSDFKPGRAAVPQRVGVQTSMF